MTVVRSRPLWVLVLIALVAGGCKRPIRQESEEAERPPASGAPVVNPKDLGQPQPSGQAAREGPAESTPPMPPAAERDAGRADRLPAANAAGRPSPVAVCGHAVAFAGCEPSADGELTLLMCDPGDNALQGHQGAQKGHGGHAWDGAYHEVPVHFGRYRPSIVLLPAGGFTITGGVVVRPAAADAAAGAEAERATRATAMPDLSQDFGPRWPGLCGPTSAADVLFDMAAARPDLLRGHPRGPNPEADMGCVRLVTGGRDAISRTSLAGRMGIGSDGDGATSEGIRDGLAAWLDDREPDRWRVDLDWLDDKRQGEREQREFFMRLASALASGGGAVLCLWPGVEFADAPTDEAAPEGRSVAAGDRDGGNRGRGDGPPERPAAGRSGDSPVLPSLPPAGFPERPKVETDQGPSLPGAGGSDGDTQAARQQAERKLAEAGRRLAKGEERLAMELASQAAGLLAPLVGTDPQVDAAMREAVDLCARIESRLPGRRRADPDKPTKYE